VGKSLCEDCEFACARLWSLVLHDLQGLGSLTTIWRSFSEAWDKRSSRAKYVTTIEDYSGPIY
jgi:hypothetical protein